MKSLMASTPPATRHEALMALREKAQKFASDNLPRAAAATENVGQAIADFALSSTQSLAQALRERDGAQALGGTAAFMSAAPMLRTAGRFARRNPVLVAGAGVAVLLGGYLIWRRREPEAA